MSTPPPPLTLILSGVSVTLPPGWTQIAAPPSLTGATNTLCATSDGTRCDLYIARGDDDASAMYIDSPVVGGPCGANSLTDYSRRTIDGQVAEFRRFHASCVGPAGEQWFVPTDPQIVFWHPLGANDAVVEQAVAAASLPAVLGHTPARDRGYIQSITQRSDGYHVTFRRAVELPSGPIPEPGAASVHSFVVPIKNNFQSTCSEWKIPGYVRGQVCNMSLWVTQSAKGAHPTDGTLPFSSVEVVLWSDSRSVAVLQTRDTFPGGV
ncbi:MAG: hypothetical protein DLM58_21480 [Pseudonocardiales bacterium]|nr:MAG: hypothetical protein DLM58_21480 [Pseudonocardiales bacterium]